MRNKRHTKNELPIRWKLQSTRDDYVDLVTCNAC